MRNRTWPEESTWQCSKCPYNHCPCNNPSEHLSFALCRGGHWGSGSPLPGQTWDDGLQGHSLQGGCGWARADTAVTLTETSRCLWQAQRVPMKIKKTLPSRTFQGSKGRNSLNKGKVPKEKVIINQKWHKEILQRCPEGIPDSGLSSAGRAGRETACFKLAWALEEMRVGERQTPSGAGKRGKRGKWPGKAKWRQCRGKPSPAVCSWCPSNESLLPAEVTSRIRASLMEPGQTYSRCS